MAPLDRDWENEQKENQEQENQQRNDEEQETGEFDKEFTFSEPPLPRRQPLTGVGSRLNAIRHGCCADRFLLLPHEDIAEYERIEALWFKAYCPHDDAEEHLVQQLVHADFLLERANRSLAQVEWQLWDCEHIIHWAAEEHSRLRLITRYQTTRASNVFRRRKAVEDYRKARAADRAAAAKAELAEARLRKFLRENPEPTLPTPEHNDTR